MSDRFVSWLIGCSSATFSAQLTACLRNPHHAEGLVDPNSNDGPSFVR
jgi:hypothetical protein